MYGIGSTVRRRLEERQEERRNLHSRASAWLGADPKSLIPNYEDRSRCPDATAAAPGNRQPPCHGETRRSPRGTTTQGSLVGARRCFVL